MNKKIIICGLFILFISLLCNASDEIFFVNNNIISPNNKNISNDYQRRAMAFQSNPTENNIRNISPFYPEVSEYSLDNGYSVINKNNILYLCFIDPGNSKLILQKSYDNGNTWSEKIVICSVENNLANGLSSVIENKDIYIALKEKDKLYLITGKTDNNNFIKILISPNITGIPEIKINNGQLNILVSKNNHPCFLKSLDYGMTWKEYADISGNNLLCLNNPSYGIAKPQLYNVDMNKLVAVYSSPKLTIQTSNDNGLTWAEPILVSEESVINGFNISGDNEDLICQWIKNNEIQEKRLALKSIGIIAGSGSAANLNNVVVYPNPFKPSTSINGYVTFANITNDVEIKIYTLAGELVDDIALINTTGSASWDCRNKKGESVASGVYLYLMKNSAGEKKTGKIVVIR